MSTVSETSDTDPSGAGDNIVIPEDVSIKDNTTKISQPENSLNQEAIPISPQEKFTPNQGFRENIHYNPTIDEDYSNAQAQNHSIPSRAHNAVLHDPEASIKDSQDARVQEYMKRGILEEELNDVLTNEIPDYRGMIREEEVRNQKQNGSYTIRWSTENPEVDHCTAMCIKDKDREHFDPSGEPHFKDFFTNYNKCQLQSYTNNTCGYHCVYYLIEKHKGLTMDEIIAGYPGDLQANDTMVTERFTKVYDKSKVS